MDVGHMTLKGCPMVDNPDDRRKPPETEIARPVQKKGFFARAWDAISERFLKNRLPGSSSRCWSWPNTELPAPKAA
jgi:hypothetical protein